MVAIRNADEFGQQIKLRRKALGLTQQQLATRCSVGIRFIIELEAGKLTCQLGKALSVALEVGLRLHAGDDDLRASGEAAPPDPDDPLNYLPRF